jgi:hypothetical protein
MAVGHVAAALFVHDRNQADAGGCENIHRIHEGRTHDAEHVGDVVGDQGFHHGFGRGHLLQADGDRAVGLGYVIGHNILSPGMVALLKMVL